MFFFWKIMVMFAKQTNEDEKAFVKCATIVV